MEGREKRRGETGRKVKTEKGHTCEGTKGSKRMSTSLLCALTIAFAVAFVLVFVFGLEFEFVGFCLASGPECCWSGCGCGWGWESSVVGLSMGCAVLVVVVMVVVVVVVVVFVVVVVIMFESTTSPRRISSTVGGPFPCNRNSQNHLQHHTQHPIPNNQSNQYPYPTQHNAKHTIDGIYAREKRAQPPRMMREAKGARGWWQRWD